MRIEIIEPANGDHAMQAWRLSRVPTENYNRDDVYAVDAPVMEMPSALLAFEDFTIFEREIFTTLRNHVIWARTSRVDDGRAFRVPRELEHPVHDTLRARMEEKAMQGLPQDQWRMDLPLVSLTSWTARMDVRTLVKLRDYLYFHLFHLVPISLAKRLSDVARAISSVLFEMGFLFLMPVSKGVTPYLNEEPFAADAQSTAGFITLDFKCSVALRAQLVRHREILFVDDFVTLMQADDYLQKTLGDTVRMQVTATRATWERIISKRSCWIAQADLWQPVVSAFKEPLLPCAEGVCPYAVDAEQRLTDKDPGCPCPRYLNLTDRPELKAQYRARMEAEAKHRPAFWMEEI